MLDLAAQYHLSIRQVIVTSIIRIGVLRRVGFIRGAIVPLVKLNKSTDMAQPDVDLNSLFRLSEPTSAQILSMGLAGALLSGLSETLRGTLWGICNPNW